MLDKNTIKYTVNVLRRYAWSRWKPRQATLVSARVSRGLYVCNVCKQPTPRKEIEIDHLDPVINPTTGYTTLDDYVDRLLVGEDKLQAICRICHRIKSAEENRLR